MNKYSVSLVPVVLLFFLSNNYQQKKNFTPVPEGTGRWTGTVTYVEIVNIANAAYTAKSERHILATFIDALPTMYRNDETTDLNFTDDKGQGSHTYHSEGTFIGGTKCVTDCQSSDKAELHAVVINEGANVYDIEVVSPTCIGTTCGEDGGTKEYGPESRSVIVSNQPLGIRKDMLDGTITVTSELPGGGTVTSTTTWHLVRSKEPDVELIVKPEETPAGYEKWMPEPGRNELSKGSVMNIFLELRGKNGKPLKVKAESFELHLSNTSREPGITINYPVEPDAKQLPDLRFLMHPGIESIDEDQFISVGSPDGSTGKALIASYDGGGYTTLTVEAILKDSSRVQGRLFVSNGETEIRIPKRDPNSNIAEKWLKENGNPGDKDDKEEVEGNTNNGDGLTAYEEYRGVICGEQFGSSNPNKFGRLDPKKKELGVRVDKAELPLFSLGLKWFENGTGLKLLRFNELEIGPDRRLNKNAATAHIYNQYALLLYKGLLGYRSEQPLGITYTTTNKPEIPANTQNIVIDLGAVQNEYNTIAARERPEQLPFTETELLANTVAHELSHGVKVSHHGQQPDQNSPLTATPVNQSPYYTFRVFDRNGAELTLPYTLKGKIGIPGSVESGDLSCVMAYYPYYTWAFTRGADFAKIYNKIPLIPMGDKMCNSSLGTGFNHSIIYFGDAEMGNCRSQIKLKL